MSVSTWLNLDDSEWADAQTLTDGGLMEAYPGQPTEELLQTLGGNDQTNVHYVINKLNQQGLSHVLSLTDKHSDIGEMRFASSKWNEKTKGWMTFTQPFFTTTPGRDGRGAEVKVGTPGDPLTYPVNPSDLPSRYLTQLLHQSHNLEVQYEDVPHDLQPFLHVDKSHKISPNVKTSSATMMTMLGAEGTDQGRIPSWTTEWEVDW